MHAARRIALVLLAAASLAVAVGCATSAGPAADDPATLVPAAAPLFVEADLHPGGAQGANAQALLSRVLRTNDPGSAIAGMLDRTAHRKGISFSRDIEPWLGARVGAAVTALRGHDADTAVIAASTDDAKAQAALGKLVAGGVARSYRGVAYRVAGGTAAGLVDHRVVAGDEAAFRAAVDASKGDSLAGSGALRDARDAVPQDRLGFLYVDVQGLAQAAARSAGNDPTAGVALQALSSALPKTIAASLQADRDALRVEAASLGTPKALSSGAGAADAMEALPGDAWLGLGVADLGKTLDGLLQTVAGGNALNGLGVQALLDQARRQTGLDIRRDVLAWMGDAGLFVVGTSPARVGGALVITTSDRAKTQSTIAALRRLIVQGGSRVSALHAAGVDDGFTVRSPHGRPQGSGPGNAGRRTWVALAGNRFVVATGARRALAEAVAPHARLGSSPALAAAAAKLGGGVRPSSFLDLRKLGVLLAAGARDGRQSAELRSYLSAFAAVAGGTRDEGNGVIRSRFVATLR